MTPVLREKLTQVAINHLLIPSEGVLVAAGHDSKDFHECSVWGIADALEEAYNLGLKEGGKKRK